MPVHTINPVSKTPKTDYQLKRDALIPEAARIANQLVPDKEERNEWSRAFLDTMDRLAREQGVVKHNEAAYRAIAEQRERS